jgi:tetratricopeptide (TPR) repeat protein
MSRLGLHLWDGVVGAFRVSPRCIVLTNLILGIASTAVAQERVVQTVGVFVARLPESNWCAPRVTVKVTAPSSAAFVEQEADLSKLATGVRFNIELECRQVQEITLVGLVNDSPVYEAKMARADRWLLRNDAAREARAKTVLAEAKAKLDQFNPDDWREILSLEDRFRSELNALSAPGMGNARAEFASAVIANGNALLSQSRHLERFRSSIAELKVARETVEELNKLGGDLQSHASRFPALQKFVETVQQEMGATLSRYFEATARAIQSAGASIDDIPALIAEGEEEAKWLRTWSADQFAEWVGVEVEDRTNALAASTLAGFNAELLKLPPNKKGVEELRERLAFIERYVPLVEELAGFARAGRERLEFLRSEATRATLKRLNVDQSTQRTSIDIGGHVVSIADLSDNLQAEGHTLTQVKTAPVITSTTQELLDYFGWLTPRQAVTALAISTAEGKAFVCEMSPDASPGSHFIADTLEIGGEQDELGNEQWVALMLRLGAVVPTGLKDRAGLTDSDRFASDPFDAKRQVEYGIHEDELNLDIAIAASLAAIEEHPEEPRYYFHLGRALFLAGEYEEAKDFLTAAHNEGYGAASYYLGNLLAAPLLKADAGNVKLPTRVLREAATYYKKAEASQYALASDQVKMVEGMLAIYLPPFKPGTFKNARQLEAIYHGDTASLSQLDGRTHVTLKYYLLGVRAVALEKNRTFRDSALDKAIFEYAPADVRRLANSKGLLGMLTHITKEGDRLMRGSVENFFDKAARNRAIEQHGGLGNEDAHILMMYLEDPEDFTQFFQNVLSYLKAHHKVEPLDQ